MSTINVRKIFSGQLPPLGTTVVEWHNPPADTVLSFYANALPYFTTPPDHSAGTASVQIGKVTHINTVDHPNHVNKWDVTIEVINAGSAKISFDLFMSWVTPSVT